MTKEEKQLLLKDICARLPYGVKLGFSKEDKGSPLTIISFNIRTGSLETEENDNSNNYSLIRHIYQSYCYKPYLRPMSSMTEEERIEFTKLFYKWHDDELFDYIEEGTEFSIWKHKGISPVVFDWLNSHHFDYRSLIPMGLALEAPEDMYKTE